MTNFISEEQYISQHWKYNIIRISILNNHMAVAFFILIKNLIYFLFLFAVELVGCKSKDDYSLTKEYISHFIMQITSYVANKIQ